MLDQRRIQALEDEMISRKLSGDFKGAVEVGEEILKVFEESSEHDDQFVIHMNYLADLYCCENNYQAAECMIRKAIGFSQVVDPTLSADNIQSLAAILYGQQRFQEARLKAEQALNEYKKAHHIHGAGMAQSLIDAIDQMNDPNK